MTHEKPDPGSTPEQVSADTPQKNPLALENADLQWQDSGAPYSSRFGDIYFSRDGGLEETDYVFLQGSRLPARWMTDDVGERRVFTIGELGFGTGLNFLRCWQLWDQTAPANMRLHFISCEKYPLRLEAMQQALRSWPQLHRYSDALLEQYPDHSPGYHRLLLRTGRQTADEPDHAMVTLDLYYGDAAEMLAQQLPAGGKRACVDAWFCDGFAPRVNPEMWTEQVFVAIAALSAPGATLSTYSVAGAVVRGLSAQGFSIEKRKGYGNKRQMLFAQLGPTPAAHSSRSHQASARSMAARDQDQAEIVVIGAGLAGCSTAWQLASRGYRVTVLEQDDVAQGASGNLRAVLQCRLNRTVSPEWQFNLQSYLYASRLYTMLTQAGDDFQWHNCGVLTLDSAYRNTRRKAEADTYEHYAEQVLRHLDEQQASALAGVAVKGQALYLPHGGWLHPVALCRVYLQHPLISIRTGVKVSELQHEEAGWQVFADDRAFICRAATVIVANSYAARQLPQTASYPLVPLRGQVSYLPGNEATSRLNCVLCAESYIAPGWNGLHCSGASYIKNSTDTRLTEAEHRQNIAGIAAHVGSLAIDQDAPLQGRAAIRGGSIDYMPMIGRVADETYWRGRPAADLRKKPGAEGFLPGLYLNAGHGSHGLATTALAADYLASCISGEALPLQREVTACIEPLRFVIRQIRKENQGRGKHGSA